MALSGNPVENAKFTNNNVVRLEYSQLAQEQIYSHGFQPGRSDGSRIQAGMFKKVIAP